MPSRKAFSYEEKVSPQATDEVDNGATGASLPIQRLRYTSGVHFAGGRGNPPLRKGGREKSLPPFLQLLIDSSCYDLINRIFQGGFLWISLIA